nr:DUF6578 domain-containing protein [Kibdelosporangium sp. MJ126-NF4]CEL14876.1 hypothetical protein [Kibdelosporangium sp. MJ126-NF4]CTQ96493.1 hypothetical protein [Kibdelosporangium sp. MJ126-NF4]
MNITVWVADWQLQCCGDAFRVGSRVVWGLLDADDEWLDNVFGPLAETITHTEEHHSDTPLPQTAGDVVSIRAVFCQYAPFDDKNPNMLHPVKESAVLRPVQQATGWEEREEGLSHAGYLVELDVVDAD